MIVQCYTLQAAGGVEGALTAALCSLVAWLEQQAGNQGAQILQGNSDACQFQLLYYWENETARGAVGQELPKELMAAVMNSLAGHPKVTTYRKLSHHS